jgi:2-aminoethylphosphonate-pyruvate transaminase
VRTILLNPGPVNVSERVRQALLGPDICHREPEFFDLQDAIRTRLLEAFETPGDDYTSILLTGSGTAMVEAMISSAVPADGRLLIVQNGVYGERMVQMARVHGIDHEIVECEWTSRPSIDAIERRLREGRFDALAIVQHETTTGLLNEIAQVADVCRRHGTRVLVDAVSALAGEHFDWTAWRPDAVACTANKCIQGLPGVSFALARRDFVEEMGRYPERSLYLHLPRHHAEQERRSTPFTPSVQIAYALRAALDELIAETVPARIARYARASALVRAGLETHGFSPVLPPELRSTTMTAVHLRGLSYEGLHDALKREGFVIYAGQGPLAATLFRVATMGDVSEADYGRFIAAVGRIAARA